MNYTPPFTITSKILSQVSDIVELLTDIKHIQSNLNTPTLRKKNRISSITGTLQIEGNSFTYEKITDVIDGKRVLGTTRELAEVQGAIKAYDSLESFNYKEIKDLLTSHKILMSELLNNAGNFRNGDVGIYGEDGVSHVAPPANLIHNLMRELFEWLKTTKEHPLIVSCIFHYEFEFIHPFSDGNGRVGRLWQTVILNHYKNIFSYLPIESIVKENQAKYYKALEDSGSLGESTPFIEFMLDIILKTLNEIQKENIPISAQQNAQQNAQQILNEINKNKYITIKELSDICKIGTRTIQKKINDLKEQNIIKRVGANKGGHWEIIKINNENKGK